MSMGHSYSVLVLCLTSTWEDRTFTATYRQPFDLLALRTRLGKEKGRWS